MTDLETCPSIEKIRESNLFQWLIFITSNQSMRITFIKRTITNLFHVPAFVLLSWHPYNRNLFQWWATLSDGKNKSLTFAAEDSPLEAFIRLGIKLLLLVSSFLSKNCAWMSLASIMSSTLFLNLQQASMEWPVWPMWYSQWALGSWF